MRFTLIIFTVVVVTLLVVPTRAKSKPAPLPEASPALREYVQRPDDTYSWHVRQRGKQGAGEFVELILTSQTWQDIPWKHQLYIYKPAKVADTKHALLLIDGGSWSKSLDEPADASKIDSLPEKVRIVTMLADMMQTPIAVVKQVPEQPLFNGLKEDEIIALTFVKFFQTGQNDWPLLLPMVKSAVRAMDTVQTFAKEEWHTEIDHFLVTGASKRGWTTWLTAAVDPRVDALAPMVINMLNMTAHDKLQRESFGTYSDEIQDYTRAGLHAMLSTDKGTALQSIVDPIAYRKQLEKPKLIVLATNDAYWPVDALNLYWDDLQGEKYILYVPNNGHGIQDYPRVIATIGALQRSVTGGKPMPKLSWKLAEHSAPKFELTCDVPPTAVRKWTATAPTRDFRTATWTSSPVAGTEDKKLQFATDVEKPEKGYRAVFLESEFSGDPVPFVLTTTLHVIGPAVEKADKTSAAE
jgi:PhoPQ-activated pathogenicity-related protein